jgi:hypothetical protein
MFFNHLKPHLSSISYKKQHLAEWAGLDSGSEGQVHCPSRLIKKGDMCDDVYSSKGIGVAAVYLCQRV